MTGAGFRKLALSMPLAEESSHMGHADFRVGVGRTRRIFATIAPERTKAAASVRAPGIRPGSGRTTGSDSETSRGPLGMVKLTPAQQRDFVKRHPSVFVPVPGGWGAKGATYVVLKRVGPKERGAVKAAMEAAWGNVRPRGVVEEFKSAATS